VIFDSPSANAAKLKRKVEKALKKALGYDVTVMMRPLAEIEETVKRNPFRKIKAGADVMLFVVFLSDDPKTRPRLPLISTTESLEVFEVRDRAAFIVSRRKKNGWFGFPNKFVEIELGVSGTARNWTTVNKNLKATERTKLY